MSRQGFHAVWRSGLLLVLALSGAQAFAAARATLQPDRISFGNTATLTIETDEANVTPDFSVLQEKFTLRGQSSSVQTMISNGQASARTSYAIELEPREQGVLTVPPIQVGSSSTEALQLTVLPPAQASAASGDPIYIESEIGTTKPYVQQAVPYTVKLFYAVPLVGGDVTANAPEHASLQQLGEDRQGQVEVNGRRYNVFERRYLLIPEQSGPVQVPAAQFRGTAQMGGNNGFFSRGQTVTAVGQPFSLEVRAQPADAPQPWLAARSLALARVEPTTPARAGEPLLIELTLTADGATSAQLPELEMPPISGAQVFPEPAQRSDSLVDGQPVATLKRRFAVVPAQSGPLQLPAMKVAYWNTAHDRIASADVAALTLDVAAGAGPVNAAPPPVAVAAATAPTASPSSSSAVAVDSGELRRWQWASALLALALLAALGWGWRRGRALSKAPPQVAADAPAVAANPGNLQRALAQGDLQDIAKALRQSTSPASLTLRGVQARLAEHGQRAAVAALESVLWRKGVVASDYAEVRAQLRAAFKDGVRLAQAGRTTVVDAPLPPLYPAR